MMRTHGWNKRARRRRATAIAIAFALAGTAAMAADNDKAAVVTANDGFYVALNTMFTGDAVPMTAVWSHARDVSYMGPNGQFETGWSAVQKNWQDEAARKLGGKVEPAEMQIVVGGDLAVVSDYEVGENTNADGKIAQLKLRATNVFRKEGGTWKMIAHHTDTLPYLAK
jgi:ketosteroid isomerase-like protein